MGPEDSTERTQEERRAFDETAPLRAAIAPHELVAINVDLGRAAEIVLGAEPRIAAMSGLIEQLPGLDLGCVRSLRDVALAARFVSHAIPPAVADNVIPKRLIGAALGVRRALLLQAQALAARGLLDAAQVSAIRSRGRSNEEIARVLVELAELFRAAWRTIGGRTPLTEVDIDQALGVARQLDEHVCARERVREIARGEDPSEIRARAFTLLVRTYDQARRAVAYLRWNEGDADVIAPSLYIGSRGGRRRRRDEAP